MACCCKLCMMRVRKRHGWTEKEHTYANSDSLRTFVNIQEMSYSVSGTVSSTIAVAGLNTEGSNATYL